MCQTISLEKSWIYKNNPYSLFDPKEIREKMSFGIPMQFTKIILHLFWILAMIIMHRLKF